MLDRVRLTNSQIMDIAAYWKKELGLSSWEITCKVVTQADIPDEYARLAWELSNQTATISIADPNTWPSETKDTDMENSIVHELVHLSMAGLLSTLNDQLALTNVERNMFQKRRKKKAH